MLYLIGGPVRVGKSTLARMVLERRAIASVSTDALTWMIGKVMPETRLVDRSLPQSEWETKFYPFLRRFVKTIQYDYDNYCLEGAGLSPQLVNRLAAKFELRCVFIGDTSSTFAQLLEFKGNNIWLREAPAGELVNIPTQIQRRSLEIAADCELYDYPFVDLAGDFEGGMEKAYQTLIEEDRG